MDALDLNDLDVAIPRGRSQACSVADLCDLFGASDRTIREGIERLVNERRVPVATLPCRDGVFVAVTPEELDAADAHLRSKAMSLLRRRRSLRLCRERLQYTGTLF